MSRQQSSAAISQNPVSPGSCRGKLVHRDDNIQRLFAFNTAAEECVRLVQQYRYDFLAEGGLSLVYVNDERSLVLKIFVIEKPFHIKQLSPKKMTSSVRRMQDGLRDPLKHPALQWLKIQIKRTHSLIRKEQNGAVDTTLLNQVLKGYELGISRLSHKHLATRLLICPLESLHLRLPRTIIKNKFLAKRLLQQESTIVVQEKLPEEYLFITILKALAEKQRFDEIHARLCAVFDFHEHVLWPRNLFESDINLFENYLIYPDGEIVLHDYSGITDDVDAFREVARKNVKYATKELRLLHEIGRVAISERQNIKPITRQLVKIQDALPTKMYKLVSQAYLEEILRRFDADRLLSKLPAHPE
ncbi:hypothetical protein CSA57_14080 [candidate division KSB3 bacterium]|nr:MAG: hypothetical protein CSA57_14080 [candidate division KSB3 bacterium]